MNLRITTNARELGKTLEGYASRVEANSVRVKKEAALAALKFVVHSTPVDTGEAISNWLVGIGAPRGETIRPHVPGDLGSTREANERATIQAGELVLATIRARGSQRDSIYISSALPYIAELNRGYSPQADPNFVELAMAAARDVIRKCTLLRWSLLNE